MDGRLIDCIEEEGKPVSSLARRHDLHSPDGEGKPEHMCRLLVKCHREMGRSAALAMNPLQRFWMIAQV